MDPDTVIGTSTVEASDETHSMTATGVPVRLRDLNDEWRTRINVDAAKDKSLLIKAKRIAELEAKAAAMELNIRECSELIDHVAVKHLGHQPYNAPNSLAWALGNVWGSLKGRYDSLAAKVAAMEKALEAADRFFHYPSKHNEEAYRQARCEASP